MASPSTNGDHREPFRIAIVGGGIGGLFTALCLNYYVRSHPIQIDVYEQAVKYKEIGAGVGLGVNAAKLFNEIGIGDAVGAIAGLREGTWISFRRFDDGGEVITVPLPKTAPGVKNLPVARSEFLDLLIGFVKERKAATLHTNKQCISVEESSTYEVTLTFKGTTTATANLVIGADGIHSAIRAKFMTDAPVYGGMIAYRAVIPMSALPTEWPFPNYNISWMGKSRHFLIFPISANKELNIVAFVSKPESEVEDTKESWTQVCAKEEVVKDFHGFDDYVQNIIKDMPDPSSKWRLNYREPLDQWSWMGGKVVMMGDAAHSMMPHQGAGAGQACEDSYVLARCMSDYFAASKEGTKVDGLQKWMQLYQDVRLPRAQKVARTSKEAGELYEMVNPELKDLPVEDCWPKIADSLRERMQWVWTEDIIAAYERAKQERGMTATA